MTNPRKSNTLSSDSFERQGFLMAWKDISKKADVQGERQELEKQFPYPPLYDRAKVIFPNGHVARLARKFDVQNRTVQKWMSGELKTPDDVSAWIDEQTELLKDLRYAELVAWAERNLERGQSSEVVTSWISELYNQMTGDYVK